MSKDGYGSIMPPKLMDSAQRHAFADPMSFTFYSQSAYTHGPYIAKYRLAPTLSSQTSLSSIKPSGPDDLMPMVAGYFTSHPAEYSLDVQMCRNIDDQPVEDTQVEWKESSAPWERLATLRLPVGQDTASDVRRTFWEDRMALSPFSGLKEHRPLGSVNRLRKEIYEHSKGNREARNGVEVRPNVGSIDEVP
jgi:hypothetical protein